jgi:hypothetical protein
VFFRNSTKQSIPNKNLTQNRKKEGIDSREENIRSPLICYGAQEYLFCQRDGKTISGDHSWEIASALNLRAVNVIELLMLNLAELSEVLF